jgi:hypothetical protein
MTKYELLKGAVDSAYTAWRTRPYGFGKAVRYLRYMYLKHKLDSLPFYAAEKTVKTVL